MCVCNFKFSKLNSYIDYIEQQYVYSRKSKNRRTFTIFTNFNGRLRQNNNITKITFENILKITPVPKMKNYAVNRSIFFYNQMIDT